MRETVLIEDARMRIPLAPSVQRSTLMEKGIRFLLSSVVPVAGVALVVACSGNEGESTFPGEGVDASTDSPGSFVIDSGGSSSGSSGGDATPGATCSPVIASTYKANFTQPTKPDDAGTGPCTTTTTGTYFEECLATVGDADHDTRCNAWKTANAACAACIEPTNNSGPIQWHQNRFYYTVNVAGCISITQDKYGDSDCGFAYGAAVNCERDACAGCFQTGTSTFDDFRECQKKAQMTGLCKTLETQQGAACPNVSTADATKACFNANNQEPPKTHYTRVMGIFCGQ